MTEPEIIAWMAAARRGERERVRAAWVAAALDHRKAHPGAEYDEYTQAGQTAAQIEIIRIEFSRSKKHG